jgi:hypothetical protein
MRASHEFSEREAWISTSHACLDPLPAPRKQQSSFVPLVITGIAVVVAAGLVKCALVLAEIKGWL